MRGAVIVIIPSRGALVLGRKNCATNSFTPPARPPALARSVLFSPSVRLQKGSQTPESLPPRRPYPVTERARHGVMSGASAERALRAAPRTPRKDASSVVVLTVQPATLGQHFDLGPAEDQPLAG